MQGRFCTAQTEQQDLVLLRKQSARGYSLLFMLDEIDEAGARARGGDCSRRMHEAIYDEE
jgi:hypothetical protein